MAKIKNMRVRDAPEGSVIVDSMGRMLVRVSDEVMSPLGLLGGLAPVCDFSGNLHVTAGYSVTTVVTLDKFDDGGFMLTRWQANVN
jgi:hypothetical protein